MTDPIQELRNSIPEENRAEFDALRTLSEAVQDFLQVYGFVKTVQALQANIMTVCHAMDTAITEYVQDEETKNDQH